MKEYYRFWAWLDYNHKIGSAKYTISCKLYKCSYIHSMKTRFILIPLLIVIILVVGIFFWTKKKDTSCVIPTDEGTWTLEIADTDAEREKWLMNRDTLCDHCGMLFVFPDEEPRTFWMKNTLIPLDIYFYDADGKLVDQVLNMRPEKETGTPIIYASRSAKYAVEVNTWAIFTEQFIKCR